MLMNFIFAFIFSTLFQTDLPVDTVVLSEIEIIASLKQHGTLSQQPISFSSFTMIDLENRQICEPKNLSLITPNLYMPDYGSKMTSSIYIRGIGSRIDQPAVGLYIDNIPVLNKNNYDFDYFDIRRIDVLRGPQGTLYGRNAIGGVINVYTLSPFDYEGVRFSASYGNKNTIRTNTGIYKHLQENLGISLSYGHFQSDGFFTNIYDNSQSDKIIGNNMRLRLQWNISEKWFFDNTFSINQIEQTGFAYSYYDENTGKSQSINHNDPCSYERFGLMNGTTFQYKNEKILFSSSAGFQFTNDEMILDQDFMPKSMFTITQSQIENAITQEFILKSNDFQKQLQWISGLYGFYRHISMEAPVNFKRDGIDELILENANKGIQTVFPNAKLDIKEDNFVIYSDFIMPAFGFSVYGQAEYQINKLKFIAGTRFDYEKTSIKYKNHAKINYCFTPFMQDYKTLISKMNDNLDMTFFEILPRFSIMYNINTANNLYITLARGYKAGGYNTQIFSDVLQNKMMEDMMADMGIYLKDDYKYDTSSAISYKPEYTWNYEAGCRFNLLEKILNGNISVFYINCKNQQLTVFPPGRSTGRLMSNAGQTKSYGVECSLDFRYNNFYFTGNYGYTNAKFVSYNDRIANYSGNYVPYAPQNTIVLNGEYNFNFNKRLIDKLILQINWQGAGKIYWTENNFLNQPFYGLAGASILWKKSGFTLTVWGKNLTNTEYNTFYFKSVGNSFVQKGKPVQAGISININI